MSVQEPLLKNEVFHKGFFSIWPHLLKKSLIGNFTFCIINIQVKSKEMLYRANLFKVSSDCSPAEKIPDKKKNLVYFDFYCLGFD